jgi:hypothetical protein
MHGLLKRNCFNASLRGRDNTGGCIGGERLNEVQSVRYQNKGGHNFIGEKTPAKILHRSSRTFKHFINPKASELVGMETLSVWDCPTGLGTFSATFYVHQKRIFYFIP